MGASWQAFYAHLCAASIIRAKLDCYPKMLEFVKKYMQLG